LNLASGGIIPTTLGTLSYWTLTLTPTLTLTLTNRYRGLAYTRKADVTAMEHEEMALGGELDEQTHIHMGTMRHKKWAMLKGIAYTSWIKRSDIASEEQDEANPAQVVLTA